MASNSKVTKKRRANRDLKLAKRRHASEQLKLKKANADDSLVIVK